MDSDGQNGIPLTNDTDHDNNPSWQALNPPACSLIGESKTKSLTELVVTVACSNENAVAGVGGELAVKTRAAGPAAASKRKRKKQVPLEPVSAQVPQSAATAIALAIPRKARRAIKRSGKAGNAALTVTLTDDLGQSTTLTQTIKVKPKRKRKK
jgi:hypothetical protein